MEDRDIIKLLNERDENAVSALMDKYGGLCRSLISHILPDRRDAEECWNNVFLALWRSIPPAQPENLKAYAAKTARNEALMVYRSNKAARIGSEVPIEELELFLPSSAEGSGIELKEALERFLMAQTPERRRVFLKRYWSFESVKEIAEAFGMSESKVTSLLFRTRSALKNFLVKEGFFYE